MPRPPLPLVLLACLTLQTAPALWVRVKNMMDRIKVASDLRFRSDDLSREAGLVIAFPQRDVHLDARAAIPVRIVGEVGEPA